MADPEMASNSEAKAAPNPKASTSRDDSKGNRVWIRTSTGSICVTWTTAMGSPTTKHFPEPEAAEVINGPLVVELEPTTPEDPRGSQSRGLEETTTRFSRFGISRRDRRRGRSRGRGNYHLTGLDQPMSSATQQTEISCYNCGGRGHKKVQCPSRSFAGSRGSTRGVSRKGQ